MSDLKALWFINKTPLVVARADGGASVRGGWLDSYIEIVGNEADIDLTVAFPDWTGRTTKARDRRRDVRGAADGRAGRRARGRDRSLASRRRSARDACRRGQTGAGSWAQT